MLKRANINWNARQLAKMAQNGTISFDNAVQRGYVWDNKRKSLLIHSMLIGYPIPPFYAAKNENRYDMLDGKQRTNTIVDFINGKYELTDVPEVEVENEDRSTDIVDINTLHFDELEESLRDEITEEDRQQLTDIYNRIVTMHGLIEDKKITKRILTRTHLVSIVPIVWKSLQSGLSDEQMAGWASEFFSGKRSASISDIYNQNTGGGSAKKESVRKRLEEIEKHFDGFFNSVSVDKVETDKTDAQ